MAQKLAKTLHVLNGDATVPEFRKSSIKGSIVVWREVLCDGPVSKPIQRDAFWEERAAYINDTFGGNDYQQKMLPELLKIRDAKDFDEVVLWFEYDLFCQINLLACLSFIEHERISLICLGDEINGQLQGLGEIVAQNFETLFQERILLSIDDLAYAKDAWLAYANTSPETLQQLRPSPTFKYLKPALEAHFQRLPKKNGLNQVEEKMLKLIKGGINDERRLIGTMLSDQGYFGLGDLQYFNYLDQLRVLLQEESLEINALGNSILNGDSIFPQPDQFIGGVFRPDYYKSKWG